MGEKPFKPAVAGQRLSTGKPTGSYGCNEYRQEMVLAGLQRSLQNPNLDEQQRQQIKEQIRQLEEAMGL